MTTEPKIKFDVKRYTFDECKTENTHGICTIAFAETQTNSKEKTFTRTIHACMCECHESNDHDPLLNEEDNDLP